MGHLPSRDALSRYLDEDPPTKEDLEYASLMRPKTRADCAHGLRPCPFVSCRYHLYLEVSHGYSTQNTTIRFNFKDKEPTDLEESCALDVAEKQGRCTLEEIGAVLNITRERVRQIEDSSLEKILKEYPWLEKFLSVEPERSVS